MTQVYPTIPRRLIAAIIDGLLIIVGGILILMFATKLGIADGRLKLLAAFFWTLLVEPIPVSVSGGSLGQHLNQIKVINRKTNSHLGLARQYLGF